MKCGPDDPASGPAYAPPASEGEDAFLGGRIMLRQPSSGLRAGLDAVMLAASVPARGDETVLEAGCGAGAASLCLARRVKGLRITGIEIDPALAELANGNAARNGLGDAFRAVALDLTAPWAVLEAHGLMREFYDHVIANPPFYEPQQGRLSQSASRERACVMPEGGLERWLRFLAAATRPGGQLTLIHRPEALGELLPLLRNRFGEIFVIPLYPKAGASAVRIILRARKGSRAPLSLKPGIVLHRAAGGPTPEAEAILREGQGLDDLEKLQRSSVQP
jgi:tRNA1(Val) A37 N6-methylase TrmN6